ncbi:uncharacterized protein LOC125725069 isoform X1 [Brienomyrus brachyistius]|uniref:uncharacterized protein LOC125725069 isoform X1 n=1 Tax=Brienomyrus brachyistius TaxID=42636 RepID=UPI0020B26344|nr:uncharacterized protein LOC125725069 isoform X1 [Brienomyrus brachyistius]XP_048857637.1 uncharacterized protein LOC125725069 isoform X1 [Brienomyrus brachyistius]
MNSIRRKRCHPLQDVKLHIRLKSDKAVIEERYINVYKGRGVFSTVDICKGDFVVEYRGELLSEKESFERKNGYSEAKSVFLYDFQWKGKNWCIDASQEDKSLGRLVNDEHRNPNCRMKVVDVEGSPHLCLFAVRDILSGEEINYNYGDSDWPWRRQVAVSSPPKEKSVQNDSQIPQLESGYIEAMDDSHAKKNKSLMDKQMTQTSDSFGEVMTAERKRKTSVARLQKLKRHHNKCLEHYVMEDNERRRLEKERTLLLCKVSQINEKLESGSGLPSASDEFGHLSADQVESNSKGSISETSSQIEDSPTMSKKKSTQEPLMTHLVLGKRNLTNRMMVCL